MSHLIFVISGILFVVMFTVIIPIYSYITNKKYTKIVKKAINQLENKGIKMNHSYKFYDKETDELKVIARFIKVDIWSRLYQHPERNKDNVPEVEMLVAFLKDGDVSHERLPVNFILEQTEKKRVEWCLNYND